MQPEVMEVLLYEKLALEWHPKTGLSFGISPLHCPKLLTRECSESHSRGRLWVSKGKSASNLSVCLRYLSSCASVLKKQIKFLCIT